MTENMITVALIVGDPGHEDLQLNQGSLAAAARMIEGRRGQLWRRRAGTWMRSSTCSRRTRRAWPRRWRARSPRAHRT